MYLRSLKLHENNSRPSVGPKLSAFLKQILTSDIKGPIPSALNALTVHIWMNSICYRHFQENKEEALCLPPTLKNKHIKAWLTFLRVVVDDKGACWGSTTHQPMLMLVFLVRKGSQIVGLCYSNTGRKTTVLCPPAEILMTQTPFLPRLQIAQLLSPSLRQTKHSQANLEYSRQSAPAFFHTTHASSLAKTSCNITF